LAAANRQNSGISIPIATLLVCLAGALLFLSFPEHDFHWLAWLGLAPLLIALSGKRLTQAFWLSFLCGVVFFTGVFTWIFEIPRFGLVHYLIISPYTGIYFGAFGLSFALISNRLGVLRALAVSPLLWVSLEYLRSNIGFLSLPWALLAHSQYQHPLFIQISAITGAYGVSFLLVLVNAAIAAIVLGALRLGPVGVRKQLAGLSAIACSLVGFSLVYGYWALSRPLSNQEITATVIQGNINRTMKADPRKYSELIMEQYTRLTRDGVKGETELVIWPEAATPGFVLKDLELRKQVISLVREIDRYFLIGSSEYPKFIHDWEFKRGEAGNTALLFSPKGKVLGQYLKIHLVPFGEYVPMEGAVSWPVFIVPEEKRNFEIPGTDYTIFEMDGARFGVVICWEIVFPELFSEFVKRGADFMVNLTNEGWFGESAAPYQMLSMSVFRSVENRISMVRAANTGVSCFIDPYGRMTGRVRNSGKDIFVEGHLTKPISLSRGGTFYTMHGDIFVYLIIGLAAVIVGLAVFRSRK
jgi:apolipoprotein N-acyltransferase